MNSHLPHTGTAYYQEQVYHVHGTFFPIYRVSISVLTTQLSASPPYMDYGSNAAQVLTVPYYQPQHVERLNPGANTHSIRTTTNLRPMPQLSCMPVPAQNSSLSHTRSYGSDVDQLLTMSPQPQHRSARHRPYSSSKTVDNRTNLRPMPRIQVPTPSSISSTRSEKCPRCSDDDEDLHWKIDLHTKQRV